MNSQSFSQFLNIKSKDTKTEVTCEQLEKEIKNHEFVMAYFGDIKEDLFTKGFEIEADLLGDKIKFLQLGFQICPSFYNLESLPGIIFFKDFGNEEVIFDSNTKPFSQKALHTFSQINQRPVLFEWN